MIEYGRVTDSSLITGAPIANQMAESILGASPAIDGIQVAYIPSQITSENIDTALEAINDGSWFTILYANEDDSTDPVPGDMKGISDWVEVNNRFFYATIEGQEGAVAQLTTSSDAGYIGNKRRTAALVHEAGTHLEAEHLSRYLATGIGFATPAPTLIGVRLSNAEPNTFSIAKCNAIASANGNMYINQKGIDMVNNSVTTIGSELWSEIFEEAWVADRIDTDITTFLASRQRTSYTDLDIASAAVVISNSLTSAGDRNIIDNNTGDNPDSRYQPTDSNFRFGVFFETRSQIAARRPEDITNGRLRARRIWYATAGNITNIDLQVYFTKT